MRIKIIKILPLKHWLKHQHHQNIKEFNQIKSIDILFIEKIVT